MSDSDGRCPMETRGSREQSLPLGDTSQRSRGSSQNSLRADGGFAIWSYQENHHIHG